MNGFDKGLVLFRGKPLISHVIERIEPQVHELLINCNRSHDQYLELGCPLLADADADYLGPLEGILSIASHFNELIPDNLEPSVEAFCMVVPCDMPFLPLDLVDRLQHNIAGHQAAYACTASQVQPLVLLLRPPLLMTIPNYLKQGHRSVMGWLQSVDAIPVSFTPANRQVNTSGLETDDVKTDGIETSGIKTKAMYGRSAIDASAVNDNSPFTSPINRSDFSNINDIASLISFS
jgi:molybdopterin-guanine dinucleotide biosynthesis protein A